MLGSRWFDKKIQGQTVRCFCNRCVWIKVDVKTDGLKNSKPKPFKPFFLRRLSIEKTKKTASEYLLWDLKWDAIVQSDAICILKAQYSSYTSKFTLVVWKRILMDWVFASLSLI